MTGSLSDRTVLVTGASKGIGAAIARRLGEEGAALIAHYGSDLEGAHEATAAIPCERRRLLHADLAVPGAGRTLWRDALAWRDRVDVLVLNAAVMPDSPLEGDDAEWDAAWATALGVNVVEPVSLMREAVRHFVEQGGGVVVSLSSWSAQRGSGNPRLIAYSASKAALRNATQSIARAHAPDGILAYVIAPGIVRTRLSEASAASLGGEQVVTAQLAMGEWVPPEEIGDLVAFLATGKARHLTGSTFDVNGASYIR